MKAADLEKYQRIRLGQIGFYERRRGLIEVKGKEAVQFLNGLITNDAGQLEDGAQMLAAFPNAQGRLLAVVRVLRRGNGFLFETEKSTHEKVFQNLFRFTYAGDFYVEDLSDNYRFFTISPANFEPLAADSLEFQSRFGKDVFVPQGAAENFIDELNAREAIEFSDILDEVLRIESGVPLYGVDMDETTIVPELGLDGLISYNKGCYIGQEIIARIYFRGHVAKQLRGLVLSQPDAAALSKASATGPSLKNLPNAELETPAGKNAGRVTSAVFSPGLGKTIALAYVRYDYLAEGTELKIGDVTATVKNLPFIEQMS